MDSSYPTVSIHDKAVCQLRNRFHAIFVYFNFVISKTDNVIDTLQHPKTDVMDFQIVKKSCWCLI